MKTTVIQFILANALSSLAHAQADMSTGAYQYQPGSVPILNSLLDDTKAAERPDQTTVRSSVSYDSLSNNLPSWREYNVAVSHNIDHQQLIEAVLSRTSRFNLHDNQIAGLYLRKFSPDLIIAVDGNVSSTHRVLPRYTLGGTINYTFLPATVGQFSVKTTSYDETRVNQFAIGIERYIGDFSLAATWRPAWAFGKSINGGEVRGSYYYSELSSIGILLAGGEEVTPVGELKVISRVRAAALIGRHRLNKNWSVSYAASHTRQGNFYNRTGVNIGLAYAF